MRPVRGGCAVSPAPIAHTCAIAHVWDPPIVAMTALSNRCAMPAGGESPPINPPNPPNHRGAFIARPAALYEPAIAGILCALRLRSGRPPAAAVVHSMKIGWRRFSRVLSVASLKRAVRLLAIACGRILRRTATPPAMAALCVGRAADYYFYASLRALGDTTGVASRFGRRIGRAARLKQILTHEDQPPNPPNHRGAFIATRSTLIGYAGH